MIKFLKRALITKSMTPEDKWLCNSTDLQQLERRRIMLSQGNAPMQLAARAKLVGVR